MAHWQNDDNSALTREFRSLHGLVKQNLRELPALLEVRDLGKVYMIAADLAMSGDDDFAQQIASLGYLMLSLGKEIQPGNAINYVKDRYFIMSECEKVFIHTVRLALNEPPRGDLAFFSPSYQADMYPWRKYYAMQYVDLRLLGPLVQADGFEPMKEHWDSLEAKREGGYFGRAKSLAELSSEGQKHHVELTKYLAKRIVIDQDLNL